MKTMDAFHANIMELSVQFVLLRKLLTDHRLDLSQLRMILQSNLLRLKLTDVQSAMSKLKTKMVTANQSNANRRKHAEVAPFKTY